MYHRFQWTRVSSRRNWISKEYEPLQPYYLMALAREAGAQSFVDVGANIGLYSMFMSQVVDDVTAYEANPTLQAELQKNFTANAIKGRIRGVAVSDGAGSVTFGIVSDYAGNSAVIGDTPSGQHYSRTVTVDAVTLDDELRQRPAPLAIKIDVEGHERAVLAGARNILSTTMCVLQIEDYDGAIGEFLAPLKYRFLTTIGPDSYFTNIESIDALAIYELATSDLISANHEDKSMIFRLGGIGVLISGGMYALVKAIAQKVIGKRL